MHLQGRKKRSGAFNAPGRARQAANDDGNRRSRERPRYHRASMNAESVTLDVDGAEPVAGLLIRPPGAVACMCWRPAPGPEWSTRS